MATITTDLLNLYRNDWAEADTVAGDPGSMFLWDLMKNIRADEKVVYTKPNTGLGYADIVNEGSPNPEKIPVSMDQLTLTQKRRGIKYIHTIEAQKFDLYGKVAEMSKEAVKAINRRKVKDGADMFLNTAFTTNIATGDPLYSDSHTINGVNFDNLSSAAALSESVVASMLQDLRGQRGPKGEPMAYGGQVVLIVPPALEFTALKIAQSSLVPGTTDNDKNVVASRIRVHVEPEATTSSTAFALVAASSDDLYIKKAVNTAIENGMDADEDGNVKMVKFAIYAYGAELPYNTIGNAGA